MSGYTLVRAESGRGPRAGLLVDETVYDVADVTGRPELVSIKSILAGGPAVVALLTRIAGRPPAGGVRLSELHLLPPIEDPGAIFCVGVNYKDHAAAMAKAHGMQPEPSARELGLNPWFFIKTAHALVGPDAEVVLSCERLDWEAELAAVIGKPARAVPVDRALEYVGAYTVANDLSARDRAARPTLRDTSPFRFDWVAHKNFTGSCPLGPALVPAADIVDPQALAIKLWVNDDLKQNSHTSQMIFNLAEQISFLSSLLTLRPGDVVLTGTPAGTGAESKTFLKRGDRVAVEIEKVGRLVTHIA